MLDAAARQLATHGVAATTVDDVAEEAGVSRATVYRYVGNRNEIIGAVIRRETRDVLARLVTAIAAAPDVATLIATVVSTAVVAIDESPVLAHLSGDDLRETLAFISIDSASLVDGAVEALAPAIETTGRFGFDPANIELAPRSRPASCSATSPPPAAAPLGSHPSNSAPAPRPWWRR